MAVKKRSAKKAKKKSSAKKRSAPKKKKGGARKAGDGGLAALARKIVRLTQSPSFGDAEIRALYNPDCTSQEGTGNVDRGHAGLEQKGQRWAQMQSGTTWNPVNVWVGRDSICIEWDATVNTRDGRTVKLPEIAVHKIKNGKIQDERFYYNPMALAPPA